MAKERNLKRSIISALIGCLLGSIAYLLFVNYVAQPSSPGAVEPPPITNAEKPK